MMTAEETTTTQTAEQPVVKPKNYNFGFLFTTKRDTDFFTIEGHAVTVGPQPNDYDYECRRLTSESLRNPSHDRLVNGFDLQDFAITAQANEARRSDEKRSDFYAWQICYVSRYKIDEADCKAMLKVLQTVNRKLQKMEEEYGRPDTFGGYCMRVAKALGATCMVKPLSNRGWSYSENEHRIMSLKDGKYHVDCLEHEWKEGR